MNDGGLLMLITIHNIKNINLDTSIVVICLVQKNQLDIPNSHSENAKELVITEEHTTTTMFAMDPI